MTAVVDGVSGNSRDKSQRYEELRSRVIHDRRAPGELAVLSSVVLVHQGMSAWMAVCEAKQAAPNAGSGETPRATDALPVPEHRELLSVLTGLVFNIRSSKKESA